MQPILVIALIGVAAAATSVGFLNTNIMLTVQNFGVGEETLETPISDANIDFSIGRMVTQDESGRTIFMNIIDACSFHYPEENTAVYPGLAFGSTKVICKLTDKNGNVVAEGTRVGMIAASQTVQIAIDDLAYDGANKVDNIHDVTIVALGDDPTFFEANPLPPNEAALQEPREAEPGPESDPFSETDSISESVIFETNINVEVGPFPELDPFSEVSVTIELALSEITVTPEIELLPEIGGTIESIIGSEILILSEVGTTFESSISSEIDPFGEIGGSVETDPFSEVDPLGEFGTIFELNPITEIDPIGEVSPIIVEVTVFFESTVESFLVPETMAENFLVPETMGENAPPPGP